MQFIFIIMILLAIILMAWTVLNGFQLLEENYQLRMLTANGMTSDFEIKRHRLKVYKWAAKAMALSVIFLLTAILISGHDVN